MILATTARSPPKSAENLASALAAVVPDSLFVKRGAKTIQDLYVLAKKRGFRRIVIVSKGRIDFITAGADDWGWSEYVLEVSSVKVSAKLCVDSLHFEGINAGIISDLLDADGDPGADAVVDCAEGSIVFMIGKKAVFSLECALKQRKTLV